MIIIKIERWPDDADLDDPREQQRAHTNIARAVLRNDHLGSDELGNYDVELYDPPPYNPWGGETLRGRVDAFPRRELGAWDLLYRALAQLVGERAGGEGPPGAADDVSGIAGAAAADGARSEGRDRSG